jgi:hypothetical protein
MYGVLIVCCALVLMHERNTYADAFSLFRCLLGVLWG